MIIAQAIFLVNKPCAVRRGAFGSLARKLSGGPGSYEGLWELLAGTYRALGNGSEPPVSARQVIEVNNLVHALKPRGDVG